MSNENGYTGVVEIRPETEIENDVENLIDETETEEAPEEEPTCTTFKLESGIVKAALAATSKSSDMRPVLENIHMEQDADGNLEIIATDGARLFRHHVPKSEIHGLRLPENGVQVVPSLIPAGLKKKDFLQFTFDAPVVVGDSAKAEEEGREAETVQDISIEVVDDFGRGNGFKISGRTDPKNHGPYVDWRAVLVEEYPKPEMHEQAEHISFGLLSPNLTAVSKIVNFSIASQFYGLVTFHYCGHNMRAILLTINKDRTWLLVMPARLSD